MHRVAQRDHQPGTDDGDAAEGVEQEALGPVPFAAGDQVERKGRQRQAAENRPPQRRVAAHARHQQVDARQPEHARQQDRPEGGNEFGESVHGAQGQVAGSENSASRRNTVESMIKPWIVSDFLRRMAEDGEEPDEDTLDELTLMIIDSNDPLAEKYFQIGGADVLTYGEMLDRTADVLGIRSGAVYVRVHRGSRAMREVLAHQGDNVTTAPESGR